ncbi:MAG: relaxase/mobilization nuclease domain-containing protein [Steroidobacteraceae bacterium]
MAMRSEPLFDPLSYARRGPGRRDHLTPAQIAQIERTVHRTPEVMVKVLPKGTNSLQSVKNHMAYISRRGKVDLLTDDGDNLHGKGISDQLIADWDLELDSLRDKSDLTASKPSAKLVHKVLFSMPPGTGPAKVLNATRNFCREEFGLKHRYVMALHTDEPHPHVHVIVKAMSEQGVRLHIRKETLRHWRSLFAYHLREVGVAANATERAVRGESRSAPKDGIYRASLRGDSSYARTQADAVAKAMFVSGDVRLEAGKSALLETRDAVRQGWQSLANRLLSQGDRKLAAEVVDFVSGLAPPLTGREQMALSLREVARAAQRQDTVR